MHVYFHVHLRTCTVNLMYACTYTCIAWYCMNLMYIVHTCSLHQGLYIVFQMGWKHFVIVMCAAKYLQSLLCPEVYPEMLNYTSTMVP